ncbi:DUF4747 family protein [Paramagnetospirillum magnetotacticum]|uniref:DUF4747 family protein n=1 Tax=Paramagnetospirillum magnetotacticum TaxID=188 RepID=UPI000596E320|nr:DUF4747 family protein [Paramagnetospirillum magnetotacticum]
MARDRTLSVGAINLRIHPHTADKYRGLLRSVYNLKQPVRVHGDRHLLMSSIDERDEFVVKGTLARFTEIDLNLPWFNAAKFEAAKDDEVKHINIPPGLKPNFRSFMFEFDLKRHLFTFEVQGVDGGLSPSIALRYLASIFSNEEIVKIFGQVNADVVADAQKLEEIFNLSKLKRLSILIKRPNPDDFGDLDEDVEDRLTKQNASALKLEFEAIPGMTFVPDKLTEKLATVALSNGRVEAVGIDQNGNNVEQSTSEHPLIYRVAYDPTETPETTAFSSAVRGFIARMMGRNVSAPI